ncbi:hypothetical protein EW026_g5331 [Hermanssonia centrifuga]|uniref:Hyaluronan/mRNA-binding protein domain-containing protein n=1 Tax=Hermanssonia centrifuga TaxID=98765 RepID=A0A4S4KED4_9APHY|nr:hypothetical protein EW026_g5331 [Hermanssonia centrifuga]
MTRTERATSPHAIIKDRSQSRTGIDRHTPKGGAGPHNWGSLLQERDLEEGALYDEEREFEASAGANETAVPTREHRSSSVSVTEEDRERALQFRKNALKSGDVDLSAIARTSAAVSVSPPDAVSVVRGSDTIHKA